MDESVNNPPPPPAAAEVRGASQSHCCCLTCASVVNCHEDIDHPGDYYCTTCWEKYDEQLLSSSSSSCALLAPPTMTSSAVGRESELFPHDNDDDDDGQPPSYPPTASKNTSIIVSRADPQPQKQNHPSSSKVADEEEDGEEETSGEEQVVVEVSTVNEKGQTLFSERGVEDEAVGGGGGAYFSTQPLASQPTLSTQDHDNSSTNRTMTTMMIPSMDQKPAISKEVDTITNTNHYLSETNQDNDVCMDYLEATETSLSVEYNDTTDNENREDDEIMGGDSMFGLLTQAAGAENGDDGTDVEDGIDDNEHIAPSTEEGIHCEEGRIADETVGFAQSIINTHERKTNLSTDQSPLIEAVMTATCLDSHGENNMALSGLTEPTTQPELSLHDSSNATLAAVEQCEAPHHGLPTTDKDITSFHHVNDDVGDDYKDTLDDDDASSAYNGLSEEEGEGNSLPDPDEATREHEGTEIANVGKQPPMQMQTVNSDSSKQVAPEESIPMDVENADIAMISMQIDESNVHCETMHAQCQPVEVDRHDAIVDNMHVPAATDQPSQRHQDGTTSDNENEDENISSSDTEMEDEMEHEHHEEGTGDTNVTFDSGYWSLYDGNTQKLPTEPSQMQDANSAMETSLGKPTTATKNCVDLGTEVISSSPPRAKPDIVDANKNDSLLDDAIHSEAGDDVLQVEPIHHASAGADNNVEGNASQPNGATCEQPPIVDAPKFDGIDEDETQLSQDLLASPAAKSNQFSQPAKPACNDVAVQDVSLNSSVSIGRELTPQRSPPPISDAKTEISDSKSLSIQKHRANETEWLQSTRNIHGTKDMLLMPSPKPLEKDGLDDSEDVGSDTQSWSGNGHNYADYAIEDTQNENEAREPSAFIRLSRDSSNLHHTSLTTMSVKNRKPNYSDRGVERSSIMKPKVLRYNALTKGDNDYSKSAESDASSEAEFDDDVCATKYIDDNHQSQTDKRILKQLEEVKAILPSVEEIQDIARKQLSDEMAKMEQSYRESIKKLKQENVKLVAQLKVAEESNRRKDQVIKEKNALLDEQFKVIEQVKRACGLKPPSLAECKSPVIRSSNKRKNASLPECQSKTNTNEDIDDDDSDDDDSDLPLSALRNTNISSNKKSRKSPVSSRAKVPTNKSISPTSLHNIDTASADTPLSDQSKAKSTMRSNLVSKNSRVLAPDVWKQLQEKGWRYQTGPEPHNKGVFARA